MKLYIVGFQPAAASAARFTNISLLSLSQLIEGAAPDVEQSLLTRLEAKTLELMKALKGLQMEVPNSTWGSVFRGKPGVNLQDAMSGLGALSFLIDAMQGAKLGEFRGAVPTAFPVEGSAYVSLPDISSVLLEGSRLVSEVAFWLRKQHERMRRAERRLAAKGCSLEAILSKGRNGAANGSFHT